MGNRRISSDLKACALRLWEHGWDVEDICKALGVSRSSCYCWRSIFEEYGMVTRPPSPLVGCTRIITRALLTATEDLYAQDSDLYLGEVCTWLAVEHDIMISTSSLSCNPIQAGLTRKVLQKIASECDEIQHEDKNKRTYVQHYGGAPKTQQARIRDVFVHGDHYLLCAALTIEGYIAARAVKGSFDREEFYDYIAEDVLPHMNPYPQECSVFVLDNCRIHHSEDLVDLMESAGW
ncbi:hypothetical protein BS17DRAFT_702405 [Gyrodon lividus]|nr:hypothetical protein BS17DRAFT_702405 [Gyrodon lividus]